MRLQTVIDANMPLLPGFIRDLLDFAGLSSNLAYITSVIPATSVLTRLVRLSNASLLKKPGIKSVEINNQRKAFLDMLAWSEGTDNGRQKTRNHGYDVIVGGELFTDYSDHSRKLVTLNSKTQINRRQTLPASFPVGGCLLQAAWPERLLSESQDAGIAAD